MNEIETFIISLFKPRSQLPVSAGVASPPSRTKSPEPMTSPALETPPNKTPPSTVPDDTLTFVENEEDGSQAYYVAHYQHFEWPEGASGPTIGIGYDCGYVTRSEAEADWTGIVGQETVHKIVAAVGYRGDGASVYVHNHRDDVTITWDQALEEFKQREVPKWLARCRAAIPNFNLLPGECRGSLFSLCYNRGTGGFDDPSPRDAEMRAIKALMIAQNFTRIPAEILSMQRLWPRNSDLWRRRAHEAALFKKGLSTAEIVQG